MRSKSVVKNTLSIGTIATLLFTTGCGGKVEGNTYEDNGGVVKVEFKSGGKAYVSTGPETDNCTYAESGKNVTLTCNGDRTAFTVDDDGALNGPPGGFLTRLTKKK
ncbi:MAG: hypothetical protein ACJ72H_07345 [Candidatus Sulfotelmatobacter sp.]|jgi:hypothetical protein